MSIRRAAAHALAVILKHHASRQAYVPCRYICSCALLIVMVTWFLLQVLARVRRRNFFCVRPLPHGSPGGRRVRCFERDHLANLRRQLGSVSIGM